MAGLRQLAEIETERLCMRPCGEADVDALHSLWTDADVRRYLWDDEVIERATAEAVVAASRASFAADGFGLCTVQPAGGGNLLGFCGLRAFEAPGEPALPEILYGFYARHWGRGHAAEAAHATLRFGFETLELPAIYGGVDPPNIASSRVLSRLGMQPWKEIVLNDLPALYSVLHRADFDAGSARYEVRWA